MSVLDRLLRSAAPAGPASGLPEPIAGAESQAGRSTRSPTAGEDMLADVLALKILHGWIQNRHQTLFPLTVNLRTMPPDQVRVLAGVLAVALLAGHDAADPGPARAWLRKAGACDEAQAALDAALASPPALSRVLDEVSAANMGAYAYVAALVALGTRDTAGELFLDYLATRLNLPTTVVRSANRRYRR